MSGSIRGWTAEEWYRGRMLAVVAIAVPCHWTSWRKRERAGVASAFAICAGEITTRAERLRATGAALVEGCDIGDR